MINVNLLSQVNEMKLEMTEEQFYAVLKRMLEFHTITSKISNKRKQKIIDIWGSLEEYTISMYDNFYEFLQKKKGDHR